MVTIIIIIGLLLAFVTGFFCATKSIQMGLRWQIQTSNKQEPVINSPSMPFINPIAAKKANESSQYSREQMSEWMFGKGVE